MTNKLAHTRARVHTRTQKTQTNSLPTHAQKSFERARHSRGGSSYHSENYLDQSFLGDVVASLCFAPLFLLPLCTISPTYIRNLQILLPRMV